MATVNQTRTDETSPASPGNPMYAGGIAVLVAFVLFMYWGSLNEKDYSKIEDGRERKPPKKLPHWCQETSRPRKKKKKKKKEKKKDRSGIYSVSDSLSKHQLLSGTCNDPDCAECEQYRIQEQDDLTLQNQRTSPNMQSAHFQSRSTQTWYNTQCGFSLENSRRGTRSFSSVRNENYARKREPERKRAFSSPEIVPLSYYIPTCTCAQMSRHDINRNSGDVPNMQRSLTLPENIPNRVAGGTNDSESIRRLRDVHLDFDCYEKETENCLADLEQSYNNAVTVHQDDCKCGQSAPSCSSTAVGGQNQGNGDGLLRANKSVQPIGDPVQNNGKVLRQLDDAFVRLEAHPDVTITIVAESLV